MEAKSNKDLLKLYYKELEPAFEERGWDHVRSLHNWTLPLPSGLLLIVNLAKSVRVEKGRIFITPVGWVSFQPVVEILTKLESPKARTLKFLHRMVVLKRDFYNDSPSLGAFDITWDEAVRINAMSALMSQLDTYQNQATELWESPHDLRAYLESYKLVARSEEILAVFDYVLDGDRAKLKSCLEELLQYSKTEREIEYHTKLVENFESVIPK